MDPALPANSDLDSDGHGRAALLLVESLIHGLVARSALSVAEAVSIVEIACEVQGAIADAEPSPSMLKARGLLSTLAYSLKIDLPSETP